LSLEGLGEHFELIGVVVGCKQSTTRS